MSENFADDLIPGNDEESMEQVEVELHDIPEDDTDILLDEGEVEVEEEEEEPREVKPVSFGHEGADFRPKPDYGTAVPKDFSVRVSAS